MFRREYARRNDLIPNEVVSATVDGASPMKAWREHLRLTQSEVASRIGVSQSADAMGISLEQLDF